MENSKNEYHVDLDLTPEEVAEELYMRSDDEYHYNQWLNSPDFANKVNDELIKVTPKYTEYDILEAISYASNQITITPSEVGKEIYDTLFSESILEYLSIKSTK